MSFLMDAAKHGAEQIRTTLGPEDDWAPVVLVRTQDGRIVPTLLELPETDEEREAFWQGAVPSMLVKLGAAEVALVMSAWLTKRDRPPEEVLAEGDRPSTAPDRIDALVVCRVSNEEEEYAMAVVTRHPDGPPTLEWEEDLEEAFSLGGRVVGALRRGLAES